MITLMGLIGVVRTVTEGETVERTVTSEVVIKPDPTVPDATTSPPSPPRSGESGRSLNDLGFAMLQQGNATGALPVLEDAVSRLRGESSITEAYASCNLAWARFSTGRAAMASPNCSTARSRSRARGEKIDRLRNQVEQRCTAD